MPKKFLSRGILSDSKISKGGEGKKVMIFFSDSRTNPSEEGEDDKNHGVPKNSKFEPAHRECLLEKTMFNLINYVKVKWSI